MPPWRPSRPRRASWRPGSKAKAAQLNADLKKRRADFEAEAKANLKAGETALQASKTQLEKQWASFEADLKTYVETVGKDVDQKRATFAEIAAAQTRAWGEAVEKLQGAAAQLGAENRAKVDKAIAQVRPIRPRPRRTSRNSSRQGTSFRPR